MGNRKDRDFSQIKSKKKSDKKLIIIGISVIGILFILMIIFASMMPQDYNYAQNSTDPTNSKDTNKTVTEESTPISNGQYFTIMNSKFQLTGDWKEGFRSEGGVGVERIRLDTTGKSIMMTEYSDKSKYLLESENAINTKKINGTNCKMISGYPAIVWFTKNGKYYQISVQNIDSSGNFEDGTNEDVIYIEEIIATLQ